MISRAVSMRLGGDVVRAMRPEQWTKNAVVAVAFFFAWGDPSQAVDVAQAWPRVLAAVVLFSLASSGVYLINDILDLEADRAHPRKRLRPIASGVVPVPVAAAAAGLLWLVAIGFGAGLSKPFLVILAAYGILQMLYSAMLKHTALVDVMVIAAGFVLRAMAGAWVVGAQVSSWLLLCAFLLALFLALCKRRQEKMSVGAHPGDLPQRVSLRHYDHKLLDMLIAAVTGATIVTYAVYTLSEATIQKFGTERLGLTIPLVMFGLFRYLDLVYRHSQGDRPERILLRDTPLILTLGIYGATVLWIFLTR